METRPTQFDFWYAVNNTEILQLPRKHLETFGNTMINYHLVSELMDDVGKVRVREGRMQAFQPQIILPSQYSEVILDGFGEEAQKYMKWLKEHEEEVRILQYGYTLKQEAFSEQIISDSLENVIDRVRKDPSVQSDPFSAILKGVDTPWDVCLIALFRKVIETSARENIREMNERHLFDVQSAVPSRIREEIERGFAAAATDSSLIKPLGKLLRDNGLFDLYQDRFFALLRS